MSQCGSCTCVKDSAEHRVSRQEQLILTRLHHSANRAGQDLCVLLSQVDSSHGGDIINIIIFSGTTHICAKDVCD